MSFCVLEVKPEIIAALQELGITKPTEIQAQSIPLIKSGVDVIGSSKTGSGKTLAFAVPILEKIIPHKGVQALIVVPTRELAVQINQEMRKFSKYSKCHITQVFGGVAIDPQIRDISRSEVVVGTPGRLLDIMRRGCFNLSNIRVVVLDEADKMVEMGFIDDIKTILDATPKNRQTLLFGATISHEIGEIRRDYMHSPVEARSEALVESIFLEQYYCNVNHNEKFSLLVHLLRSEKTHRVIIFCSARNTVEIVTRNLLSHNIDADMIHGKMGQAKRMDVIEKYNKGHPKVLVASPVAARGLDIKDVSHVINYDLSSDPQEYVHRIGRTARAGESGKAITLLSHKDYDAFGQIIKRFDSIVELNFENVPKVHFHARASSENNYSRENTHRSFNHSNNRPRVGFGANHSRHDDSGPRIGFGRGNSENRSSSFSDGPRRGFGNRNSEERSTRSSFGGDRSDNRFSENRNSNRRSFGSRRSFQRH